MVDFIAPVTELWSDYIQQHPAASNSVFFFAKKSPVIYLFFIFSPIVSGYKSQQSNTLPAEKIKQF